MPESLLFSVGVDTLLHAIRPHGRKRTSYPPTLDGSSARRVSDESLHAWFKRLVDNYCGGEPKRTAIEDNIAVFVILGWDSNNLYYANSTVSPMSAVGSSIGA
jgi:hypothetical protein